VSDQKEGGKKPPPRSERLLQLAGDRYELRRTSAFPYLLRGDRRYLFEGQDRRDLGADMRAAWRTKYPDDGVPSRGDIAQVLDDLRLHAELTDADPPTAGEQADELIAEADTAAQPADGMSAYYTEGGCTWWSRPTQGGPVPTMLATFTSEIAEELTLDDGAERTLTWLLRVVTKDGRAGEVRITPDQLGRPQQWAAKAAGTSALVMPGLAIADHLRAAVQSAAEPECKTVYTHTGWRELGGRHVYLTSSGALGADGLDDTVTVDLGTLSGYALPAPAAATAVRDAVRSSLSLVAVAPDAVIVPLLAAVYRAPLPLPPDCTVWEYGRSGTFKTALTALGQQHFGPTMDAYNLPGNWTSTANSLVMQAHALKDALFTVDDYSPDITKIDAQRRAAAADQLIRGGANRAGRGRLRPDGTRRPDKPPQAQLLASAEDLPPAIESLLARSFLAEVKPGDVKRAELTKAQGLATDGQYAVAMAGYIRHLATRYDADGSLPAYLAGERGRLRDEARADGQHPRTALNVASLALGWSEFLAYALTAEAITSEEHERLWTRAWKALCEVGADQDRYRRDADPVTVYLTSLSALIASGGAHIAALNGGCPADPIRWGWEEYLTGGDIAMRPRGELIGWTDGKDVHLEPDAAYRAARRFAETSGGQLGIAKKVLHGHLRDRGLLATCDPGHLTARHDLGGRKDRRNLHMSVHSFETDTRP